MKTRPHEETWEPSDVGDVACGEATILQGVFVSRLEDEEAVARAKLAAQAPAMARLLLIAYEDVEADANLECLGCGWTRIDSPAHAADCELVAVLRAAGVLP